MTHWYRTAAAAVRAVELLTEALVTERRRTTIDNGLAEAQTRRTEARMAWIDRLVDALVAVFPERRADLELMRIDLRTANDQYTETLNTADRAIIDRVTAIVANETLDREEAERQIWAALRPLLGGVDEVIP